MMTRWLLLAALTFVSGSALAQGNGGCAQATDLVTRAFHLGQSGGAVVEQRRLLDDALRFCPAHPEAHNNLGLLLEDAGDLEGALDHYRRAVQANPRLTVAWYGIGDVQSKRGALGPALEAYLHACKDDRDAQRKAKALLDSGQYKVAEDGKILDKESLLLLFDKARRAEMEKMIADCGFKAGVQPVFVFRNIQFDTGSATLAGGASTQVGEIGEALREAGEIAVVIAGHTDSQPFRGVSATESAARNRQLSKERADSVARQLAAMGISKERLLTEGFGPDQPEAAGNTPEAHAKNRRVVIEVK